MYFLPNGDSNIAASLWLLPSFHSLNEFAFYYVNPSNPRENYSRIIFAYPFLSTSYLIMLDLM